MSHNSSLEKIYLARLHLDGTLDDTFQANLNGSVRHIHVLSDNKIFIMGRFTRVDGVPRRNIAVLHPHGELDQDFDPGFGPSGLPTSVVELDDGSLLLSGRDLNRYDGEPVPGLIRLFGNQGPGSLQFSQNLISVSETSTHAIIPVKRVGGSFGDITAWFHTVPQSAGEDLDFEKTSLHLSAPENDIGRINISVPIHSDPHSFTNRSFAVRLYSEDQSQLLDEAVVVIREALDGAAAPEYTPNFSEAGFALRDIQNDGSLLISSFNSIESIAHLRQWRPDGSPNDSFALDLDTSWGLLAVTQEDGKILVAGEFYNAGPENNLTRIARLNPDLSVDLPFSTTPNSLKSGAAIRSIYPLPGGEVLVQTSEGLRSLSDSGADVGNLYPLWNTPPVSVLGLDTGETIVGHDFNPTPTLFKLDPQNQIIPEFSLIQTYGPKIMALALQNDGRILVGGRFQSIRGVERLGLARLFPDGSLDPSFNAGSIGTLRDSQSNDSVQDIEVLPGGDIIIAGKFETVSGIPRRHLARLAPDGALRPHWDAHVQGTQISEIKLLDSGDLVVYGAITNMGGVTVHGLARIHLTDNSAPVTRILSPLEASTFVLNTSIPIDLHAYDPDGLLPGLKIYLDGELYTEFDRPPYQVQLTPALGTHTIRAEATDSSGATTIAEATFTVVEQPVASTLSLTQTADEWQITAAATPGTTYTLESSTDLITWFPVAEQTATTETFRFTLEPSNEPRFFYRLRLEP